MKTMSQIKYHIDELLREKKAIKNQQIEEKVDEFTKIMIDMPPKDNDDLKRLLRMFAKDVKYITQQ
ncbi:MULTISPECIES: hypothetical protein [unclassified Paenibacillus]|uniref:hypothetical protein n=1 Tax=unclassified Paenibacillus TaxID=185978 RepID=UPI00020D7276|nr:MULTISPECIES: hypothetical protein [unclassified Paenibacillus]EGL17477.1 hypothetical protein HMPREF9413_5374 [Paenibacillus sp. HGF7]EPD81298.1 hypothetical protein HMPREF1207_05055 [Paenibacillus sp. HGH0039]